MHPGIAQGNALRANLTDWSHVLDQIQMRALLMTFCHFTPVNAQFAALGPVVPNFAGRS
jgi:hypothetical protein